MCGIPSVHSLNFDELFLCGSAKMTEDLQPSAANDRGHVEEMETPRVNQEQGRVDPVAPAVEQPAVAKPAAPAMEEPSVTGPTSPSDGAHDEGDSGDEGLWSRGRGWK